MPELPFTPSPQATTEWRRCSDFHARRAMRAASRGARCADIMERQLSRLPGGDLWQAVWRSDIGVHWAFWVLFVAPVVLLFLSTRLMSGWGLLVIDVASAVWMTCSFILVWRAGYGHTGWGTTPILYRALMACFLLPLALMLVGVLAAAMT